MEWVQSNYGVRVPKQVSVYGDPCPLCSGRVIYSHGISAWRCISNKLGDPGFQHTYNHLETYLKSTEVKENEFGPVSP